MHRLTWFDISVVPPAYKCISGTWERPPFVKISFEHSVISLRTSVIKTIRLLGCWVRYSRVFRPFGCDPVGETRSYLVTGARQRLETVVCLPVCRLSPVHSGSPPSCGRLRAASWETFITSSTGGTLNPFCVSKYFSLPITHSQKSEKGPINLAGHYLSPPPRCRGHGE